MTDCGSLDLFQTECLNNLVIKLTPTSDSKGTCFSQAYPDLKFEDLIISDEGTVAGEESCSASEDGSDGMFFYGNQDLNAQVTEGAPFYFLASKCGTDHAETAVDGTTYMQFTTTLMSSFTATGGEVMTHQEMLETDIVCNYETNIDGIIVSIDTELDAVDNDDKIEEDDTAQALDSAVVVHSTVVDSQTYVAGDDVTLGSLVEITFNSVGEITTGFYIDSCTATNDAKNVQTILIQDGCANTNPGEPIASINPGVTGVTLNYDQFAYVASSSDAGDPTLEFNLSCVLKFGTQPTAAECAAANTNFRRRRRSANDDEGATTEIDIPVTQGDGNIRINSDGVVTSDNQDGNSGVEQLAAALATSAFLLL